MLSLSNVLAKEFANEGNVAIDEMGGGKLGQKESSHVHCSQQFWMKAGKTPNEYPPNHADSLLTNVLR